VSELVAVASPSPSGGPSLDPLSDPPSDVAEASVGLADAAPEELLQLMAAATPQVKGTNLTNRNDNISAS
jgi:hypothetical protein